MRGVFILSAAVAALGGCGSPSGNEASVACDRACLVATTDSYLAALAVRDPSAVPLADDVRFVENLERKQPGEGLWKTATGGKTDFSIYVPDETQQQVGWLGVIENEGKPLMLAVRLRLDGSEIAEIEHISVAPSEGSDERIAAPRPGLITAVPESARLPADELRRIGATYYEALTKADGSLMPFASDCARHENGFIAAGEGANTIVPEEGRAAVSTDCAGQLDSNAMAYIARIDNRRVFAADPVTGLAIGFSHFRHPFDNLPYKVTLSDGTSSERNARNMPYDPFDMPAAHIFKIGVDGKVHEIEAIGFVAPYNSPTGWE